MFLKQCVFLCLIVFAMAAVGISTAANVKSEKEYADNQIPSIKMMINFRMFLTCGKYI